MQYQLPAHYNRLVPGRAWDNKEGAFTMALSAQLESAGFQAERLDTTATVNFKKVKKWKVTSIHL